MSVLISDSFKIRENTSDEWENIQFSINSPGVPAGGQAGQFLIKNSNLDYDTKWTTPNVRYFFSLMWELIYPVGSYYWSSESTSPEVLFGGTWEQVKDTFILAAGNNYIAGSTGGEATHTLIVNEIPSHTHKYAQYIGSAGWSGNSPQRNFIKTTNNDGYTDTNASGSMTTFGTGEGQSHNNMPPYITAYCWHRIA